MRLPTPSCCFTKLKPCDEYPPLPLLPHTMHDPEKGFSQPRDMRGATGRCRRTLRFPRP